MIYIHTQVCGHKWKYRGEARGSNRYVHGQCLVAGRNLTNFKLLRPCTPTGTFVYYYVCVCMYVYGVCVQIDRVSFTFRFFGLNFIC